MQISENKESTLVCSETELQKVIAKCNKENDIEEDNQPLFIDWAMEAVMCKWCPTWNGSQKVKVINQHTKASKSHQVARQKALGVEPSSTRGVQDIRKYFLPISESSNVNCIELD